MAEVGGLPVGGDPVRLAAVLGELRDVHSLLTQLGDMAAEFPGVDLERVAGVRAGAVLVAQRIRLLEGRADSASDPGAGVVVVEPDRARLTEQTTGQALLPVVCAPQVGGVGGVSSGVSWLASGAVSRARVHQVGDVILVVLFGWGRVTWWDRDHSVHEVDCVRHQHVHIPRGTPYALSNPGAVPMMAIVVQSASSLMIGVELVPALDWELLERTAM